MPGSLIDAIYIVMTIAIVVAVVYLFIADNFQTLARQIALESAEVVAKDIAGFITISGAAPDEINIELQPSTKFKYDVNINNRIVGVKSLLEGEYTGGPTLFGTKLFALSWNEKTAVDPAADLKNIEKITIQKNVVNGKYVYTVKGS